MTHKTKTEVDTQREKVLLRDAKYFHCLNKIINKLEDSRLVSAPANLYQLTQLKVSDLGDALSVLDIEKLQFAMKKWHCKLKNFLEPFDIMYYDNTGKYYHKDENGDHYYPEQ